MWRYASLKEEKVKFLPKKSEDPFEIAISMNRGSGRGYVDAHLNRETTIQCGFSVPSSRHCHWAVPLAC
jgi:hypothetical protein